MSVAIGLDVSELRMGWAVVSYDDQAPLALGVSNLRRRDGGWPEDQILDAFVTVRCALREAGRDRDEVMVVGIEDAYLGPNRQGSLRHAAAVGMATMAARVTFGPAATYWPIPNGEWIRPLGITPASRKRDDVKAATAAWAESRMAAAGWPVDDVPMGQDAYDALGVATACALLTVPTGSVGGDRG